MATTPDESGDAFEIAIAPSRDGPVIEAESVPDEALSREVSGAMRDVTAQATPASPAVPVESGTVMAANAAHDEARETEEAADQHAQAVEAEARLNGFATILFDTQGLPELEKRAIELLAEYRVDGVVWALIGASPAEQPPFPTVLIDRPVEGFDGVYTDHARGGQLAAELAGSLGHSRLGLLSGPQDVASAAMRRAGFMSKLTPGSKIVWEEPVPFGRDLPSAAVSALERNEVSFIFAANDLVALSAMAVLERAKIDVPEEVSVLGYDDISWAELPQIALSTIRQPLPDLGRAAFQLLQQRMDQPGRDIAHMMLEPCVQTRSTTR